ncbi:PRP38 family-domain-containing protein [Cantharellus anzutake]|uniref:PRP38 family-domain-containing protein n=1 Tax=Cantharellus anzutake TaxID=1750568 RepID=UPI001904E028|nr:PRP38 family-domain-containing protein [Cantharellus anzutake]KAF8344237.1 PRP38 family-domain-containing protein [Cantharellus anzutake]
MANTTVRGATQIHGANPQFLIEKVIRSRIYESTYWKEHCFALTAESLIDKAIELNCIGGVYGNQRPTQFICLLLKLLQIQPEKEILVEYLLVDEFKYLRALAVMYIRMTFRPVDVHELLEPLLKDYRKLRLRNMSGYVLTYMDEFIDQLLTEERVCDTILPRIPKRNVLEETEGLAPRTSSLMEAMEGNERKLEQRRSRSRSDSRSGSRSTSRSLSRGRSRSRSRSGTPPSDADANGEDRYVSRSPSRSGSSYRSRSRSISPDRMDLDDGDRQESDLFPGIGGAINVDIDAIPGDV